MVIQKNKTRNRTSSSKPNCCQSQSGPLQAVTTEGGALPGAAQTALLAQGRAAQWLRTQV